MLLLSNFEVDTGHQYLKQYRIRRVKSKCMTCRKKITESQQMGQIPNIGLKPASPFYLCAVDLFGPLVIKYTVKKRTHGKEYGTCQLFSV